MLAFDSKFRPHPNLGEEVNSDIIQSEVEGGVSLEAVPAGAVLEVVTSNHTYTIEYLGNGQALIHGHPIYCPQPVMVEITGSTFRNSMIKLGFIGRGMYLEIRHPEHGLMRTSRIEEIRELPAAEASQRDELRLAS